MVEFKPQLALHRYKELEKKTTKVADDVFAIFEKYDGWYGYKAVNTDVKNNNGIMSRKCREIPSLARFSASMAMSERVNNIGLQGTIVFEILIKGVPVFKDLNGILNRSKGECEAKNAYLMVHDFVPFDAPEMPFLERYAVAKAYVKMLDLPNVYIAPILMTGTEQHLQESAEVIWANPREHLSNEGAIGKRVDAQYSMGKRNKDVLKVKCEVTLEGTVVGWEHGAAGSKYEHTLGKLIVRTSDGTQHHVSGMSDDERDVWSDDFSLINGAIVELQAMQVLANGSLREGRYKCQRFDKNEID